MALARGARVAGVDYAAAQSPTTGNRIEIGGTDLTDAAQAKKAIDAAAAHFGRLDALINIAGGFAYETVAEGDPKTWQRMYALNVLTALNASRAALPHLAASAAGRIVNVGAMGALQAGAGMGAYAASKAGVHRLTEALAAEWKGKVTVNAVLPSTIDTPANRTSMPKADFAKWVTLGSHVLVHALPLFHQHGLGGVHATLIAGSTAHLQSRIRPGRPHRRSTGRGRNGAVRRARHLPGAARLGRGHLCGQFAGSRDDRGPCDRARCDCGRCDCG